MPTYLVLLGPPGAGKGTQAQRISKKLNLPHISSGDIFRENLKHETELGRMAKGFIEQTKSDERKIDVTDRVETGPLVGAGGA